MPITPCAPCNCIGGNISNDKFKQDVEILLCQLVSGGAAVGKIATPLAMQQVQFGTLTGAFVEVSTDYIGSWYKIENRTTADLVFSLNGTDAHFLVEANSEEEYGNPALSSLDGAEGLWVKTRTADLPDSGYVTIMGIR